MTELDKATTWKPNSPPPKPKAATSQRCPLACGLTDHAVDEGGRLGVGVSGGGTFKGRRVGDRATIANGMPVVVATFSGPGGHQLHFPCLGSPIGLLPFAVDQL